MFALTMVNNDTFIREKNDHGKTWLTMIQQLHKAGIQLLH